MANENLTPEELELLEYIQQNPNVGIAPQVVKLLLADLDAARGAVSALPKTADGVPIVPGMILWRVFDYGGGDTYRPSEPHKMDPIAGFKVVDGAVRELTWRDGWSSVAGDLLYSTHEAALAAKGTVQP